MGTLANLFRPRTALSEVPLQQARRPVNGTNSRAKCGNPSCSGSWLAFLKDRRRPAFDGHWGCSPACVKFLVDTAVRREFGESGAEAQAADHRHRIPLGLILLTQGWITHAQLEQALDAQRIAGTGRIGQWLMEVCGLEQERITRALSLQWGCPALTTEGLDPAAMALAVPRLLVEQLGIVPLRIAANRILYLGFADQLDASAAFAVQRMSGLKVQSGLVDEVDWQAARQRICHSKSIDCTFEHASTVDSLSTRITSALVCTQPRASRMVRIHQFYWLRMWLESGAMGSLTNTGIPTTTEDVIDRLYTVGLEQ